MTADLDWLALLPGRCPACLLHIESQGHRASIDGMPTDCEDSGPLGLILGRQGRDEGMARTTAADADGADRALIDEMIERASRAYETWSANDLRRNLPNVRQPLIGARIRAAAKAGRIVHVGYTPSDLPSTHAHDIKTWRGSP